MRNDNPLALIGLIALPALPVYFLNSGPGDPNKAQVAAGTAIFSAFLAHAAGTGAFRKLIEKLDSFKASTASALAIGLLAGFGSFSLINPISQSVFKGAVKNASKPPNRMKIDGLKGKRGELPPQPPQ